MVTPAAYVRGLLEVAGVPAVGPGQELAIERLSELVDNPINYDRARVGAQYAVIAAVATSATMKEPKTTPKRAGGRRGFNLHWPYMGVNMDKRKEEKREKKEQNLLHINIISS